MNTTDNNERNDCKNKSKNTSSNKNKEDNFMNFLHKQVSKEEKELFKLKQLLFCYE